MMMWRLIDSAPDDYVLAGNEDWDHPEGLDMRDFGEYCQPVGWNKTYPTHWMPLPEPPK